MVMRRRFFNNNIKNFDINDYLTIEALEDNLQVYFPYEDLMYGIDGLGWQKLIAGAYSPAINKGQTISFKGNVSSNAVNRKSFTITKKCNLLGNCMSLTSSDIPHFYKLFSDCAIVYISKDFLPATTLDESCYESMFQDCSSLISAPELPATTLATGCYSSMFYYCTSLTTAPELPATTLASDCYRSMFFNCTGLTVAPELPATTLADNCYMSMFYNCTGLTVAPELPATTLADYCYNSMFYGCSNLNYIKMLATDISASSCLSYWVYNVSSTGTFVKNPAMTTLPTGISGIPSGWTVVDDTGGSNEEVLPESTEFGFPLYLNTDVTYDEGYYQERRRTGDKILEDFYQWFEDNKVVIELTGDQEIPAELLEANPIYIDGNRVVSIYMSAFGHNMGFENNMYNDKSINTLDFSFSATELAMYIYFNV